MNRLDLQKLALTRLEDARVLLTGGRWSAAYYLTGYAVECGLKACLLRYLGESAAVFGEAGYLKNLQDCWTHGLLKLVKLAGLDDEFGRARGSNPLLEGFWTTVKDWKESSRYAEMNEAEAKALYEAVTDNPNGVLPWIQTRW